MKVLLSSLVRRDRLHRCRWLRCRRNSVTERPLALPHRRRTPPYCSTRCVVTLHSSPAEMKSKPSGASSRPSKKRGRNCLRHRSRTIRLEPAVRRKPTLLSPATIVGGVASNSRYKRPHENVGSIQVCSRPGDTRFQLFLPLADIGKQ